MNSVNFKLHVLQNMLLCYFIFLLKIIVLVIKSFPLNRLDCDKSIGKLLHLFSNALQLVMRQTNRLRWRNELMSMKKLLIFIVKHQYMDRSTFLLFSLGNTFTIFTRDQLNLFPKMKANVFFDPEISTFMWPSNCAQLHDDCALNTPIMILKLVLVEEVYHSKSKYYVYISEVHRSPLFSD